MMCCRSCGSFVRHWTDTKTNIIHYQCTGCRKKWEEEDHELARKNHIA